MGLGGATVVTIYKRFDGKAAPGFNEIRPENDGRNRLGYNPAEEARSITKEDWESVKSHNAGSSEWAAAQLPWLTNPKDFESRARL
jgi:sterol carrier protein 2